MANTLMSSPEREATAQAFSQIGEFVTRLAAAWDFRGDHIFSANGREHRALLELAGLPTHLAAVRWDSLDRNQRYELLKAARRAVEFGRQAAWIFGEGSGARF